MRSAQRDEEESDNPTPPTTMRSAQRDEEESRDRAGPTKH
jgi:hypothetical protein